MVLATPPRPGRPGSGRGVPPTIPFAPGAQVQYEFDAKTFFRVKSIHILILETFMHDKIKVPFPLPEYLD